MWYQFLKCQESFEQTQKYFMDLANNEEWPSLNKELEVAKDVNDEFILSRIDVIIKKYLGKRIKEKSMEITQILNLDNYGLDEEKEDERRIVEKLFMDMKEVIDNPENYKFDLYAALYMAYLYNNEKYDLKLYSKKEMDSFKNQYEKDDYKIIKEHNKVMKSINSVWDRADRNEELDEVKDEALKRYPIPINRGVKRKGTREDITLLAGGSIHYHKVMISKEHINLFRPVEEDQIEKSNEEQGANIKRYTYGRINTIYEAFKNTRIQNLLLMEYSLGIGYINYTYPYIKRSWEELETFSSIIKSGADLSQIYIRKKIMELVWRCVYACVEEDPEIVETVQYVIDDIKNILDEIFSETLQFAWYIFRICNIDDNTMNNLEYYLINEWEKYYDDHETYLDMVKEYGTRLWRQYPNVDSCFCDVTEYREASVEYPEDMPEETRKLVGGNGFITVERIKRDTYASYFYVEPLYIVDSLGHDYVIRVQKSTCDLGRDIVDEVKRRLSQMILPDDYDQIADLFYDTRQQVFDEFKANDNTKMVDDGLRIPKKINNRNKRHIYAKLVSMVLDISLNSCNKRSGDAKKE